MVDGQLYVTIERIVGADPDDVGARTTILAIDAATGERRWAIDPRAGRRLWAGPFGAVGLDDGEEGTAIFEVDGRPHLVGGSGRLLDLTTGHSALLFETVSTVSITTTALADGVLLVNTDDLLTGSTRQTVISGWSFDPAAATLGDAPIP